MRRQVREVHLLLLHLKGLTQLLDARFGSTYTIHSLRETQKQGAVMRLQSTRHSLSFVVTVMSSNTWTERARLSISEVQSSTTKCTWSGRSRVSVERSTPNTAPFLCSHSNWHTSMHFLCKASPHCTDHVNSITPNPAAHLTCTGPCCPLGLVPPRIQFH